jgi:von Willebrand factor type A domain
MGSAAEIPNGESTGLCILDIVKHAVKTIIKSMKPSDRLAIVSFSNSAETLIPLTEMTSDGQTLAITALERLCPTNSTNLWAGITIDAKSLGLERGLDVLKDGTNLKACFILTDGESNSDPPR